MAEDEEFREYFGKGAFSNGFHWDETGVEIGLDGQGDQSSQPLLLIGLCVNEENTLLEVPL